MRTTLSPAETWSSELVQATRQAVVDLHADCPALMQAIEAVQATSDLERVLAASEFAQRTLRRRAAWIAHAARDGRLTTADGPRIDDVLAQVDDLSVALRTARDRELLLICWHDLLGHRSTRQTLAALTELADRLIVAATEACLAQMLSLIHI